MLYTDQLNRQIEIIDKPKRIISTVPSQTEMLVDLGLENQLVGITKFCIHPSHLKKEKNIVGGTKNLNLDKIRALQPDLIIANKEENTQSEIEALCKEFPVWISDIYTIQDSLNMMADIGKICQVEDKAKAIINFIEREFGILSSIKKEKVFSAAYFIWREPYMIAAKNTFINEILYKSGFVNAFEHLQRYPIISSQDISHIKADCIFLSSEPYPFQEKHIEEFKNLSPFSKIIIVDGELFSWYGTRLMQAAKYLKNLYENIANSNLE